MKKIYLLMFQDANGSERQVLSRSVWMYVTLREFANALDEWEDFGVTWNGPLDFTNKHGARWWVEGRPVK